LGAEQLKEKESKVEDLDASSRSASAAGTSSSPSTNPIPTPSTQTTQLAMGPSLLQSFLAPIASWLDFWGSEAQPSKKLSSAVAVVVPLPASPQPEPIINFQIRQKRFLRHVFKDTLETGLEKIIVTKLTDRDFRWVVSFHIRELAKESETILQGDAISVAHLSSVIFWPAVELVDKKVKEKALISLLEKVYSAKGARTVAIERILDKARLTIIAVEKEQHEAGQSSGLLEKLIKSGHTHTKELRQDMLLTVKRKKGEQAFLDTLLKDISPDEIALAQTKEVKLTNELSPLQQTYRYLIEHYPKETASEHDKKQWQSRNEDFQKIITFLTIARDAEDKAIEKDNAFKEIRALINNPFRNLSLSGAARRVESLFSKPLWAQLSNSGQRIKEPHFRDKIFALKDMDNAALLEEFHVYQEFMQQEAYREKTDNQNSIFKQVNHTILSVEGKNERGSFSHSNHLGS